MLRTRSQDGQASVEVVALLPLVALLAVLAWQAALAAQAMWLGAAAARAAARAHALGAEPLPAARGSLPPELRRGLSVQPRGAGVLVRLPVPAVVGGAALGSVTTRAGLPPQTP